MVRKSAYIISLKFAPGLMKEFAVIGENLKLEGFSINYLLANSYKHLDYELGGTIYLTTSKSIKEILYDSLRLYFSKKFNELMEADENLKFVLFYNPHILNFIVARIVKKRYKRITTVLYLHDPYKSEKRAYGFFKALYISLVELLQKLTVNYIDHVIFPSEYSHKIFLNHYQKYRGQLHIAPLLVPDQWDGNEANTQLFSIVGGYHNATGHDTFIKLINYVAENNLDFRFGIVSSSDISKLLSQLSVKGRGLVEIINKKLIKDSEINAMVCQSYGIFRLDREVTQSGVVPVAFMNGTPVIVRDIPGLTQHVKHGFNGYIVPFACTFLDLVKAMEYIINNYEKLSLNARKSYENLWADNNFIKYYFWINAL
jgi:glycosyltransferase involved in cell wall biosynthesis